MNKPATKLDTRFSDPGAVATEWDETRRLLETAELFWISTVSVFHHKDGVEALVFSVMPTRIFAFAKGTFSQTRYRF